MRDLYTMTLILTVPKSLYGSRAGRHFYGAENEISAGFGPVGNTEKKIGANYEQLISCFQGQKKSLKFSYKLLK